MCIIFCVTSGAFCQDNEEIDPLYYEYFITNGLLFNVGEKWVCVSSIDFVSFSVLVLEPGSAYESWLQYLGENTENMMSYMMYYASVYDFSLVHSDYMDVDDDGENDLMLKYEIYAEGVSEDYMPDEPPCGEEYTIQGSLIVVINFIKQVTLIQFPTLEYSVFSWSSESDEEVHESVTIKTDPLPFSEWDLPLTVSYDFLRETQWISYYKGEGDNTEDIETEHYSSYIEIDMQEDSWGIDEQVIEE
jgi:hypothetical protein